MKAGVVLKNGTNIEFNTNSLSLKRDPIGGGLAELGWDTPEGYASRLVYVNIDEVVAVYEKNGE